MSTHNGHNSFADDEKIFDYVGGAADDQAAQVGTITSHERSGVSEAHHEDVLEGFHNSTDLADLRSPLYDVEHYDLNTGDASIVQTQSAPWDPGRVSDTAHRGTHRHAPSGVPTFIGDATRREAHQYSSLGHGVDGHFDAQHAHSSTNGINQWDDLSNGHESSEGSYSGHRIETAPISSPSPSAWSTSDRMERYLSPTTQSSRHATHVGETRSKGATATSTTRSVRSAHPSAPSFQRPSGPFASEESSNSTSASLHVCFPCNKIFATRAGLRHHRETHDEAKMNAHRCPMCQRGFRYPKDMERHLETHEDGEVREGHLCPEAGCFKTFTRKDNLKRHLKKTLHG